MAAQNVSRLRRSVVLLLAAAFVLLPLLIVHAMPTDSEEPYIFRAQLSEELGQSPDEVLTYYRADVLEGAAPSPSVTVALDRDYTRGFDRSATQPGFDAWFQGSLRTPTACYMDQCLYCGLSQVYVRQVKTGLLWPDQWSGLRVLYLSPLSAVAAPIVLPFFIRSDSFSYGTLLVLVARCIVVAAAIVLVIRRRLRREALCISLLACAVLAALLTVPILTDLY